MSISCPLPTLLAAASALLAVSASGQSLTPASGSAIGAAAARAATTAATAATPATDWVATRTRAHAPAYEVAVDNGALGDRDTPIAVAISLQVRNPAGLAALTDRIVTTAGSAAAAAPLSRQQFLDRHAPTAEQAARVVAHLQASGFTHIVVADNRLLVTADGTPGAIRTAFQAELHAFDVRGRRAFANVTDARVPAALADTVLAVVGLQTVQLAHTNTRRATPAETAAGRNAAGRPVDSDATSNATNATNAATAAVAGVYPSQFARIYGADGLPSASTATLGIITQGSMTQTVADLKTAAANAGYPTPVVSVVTVGTASSDTSGVDEWNLDTQTSLAAAGGTVKGMVLYTATTLSDANLTTAYNRAVSDNLAQVINVSLGECENSANTSGVRASNDQIFQAAVAQGQTVVVASGDSGSYECGGSSNAQSYPAVSPYVMAIGGTTLSTASGAWAGETAWSCSSSTTCPQSASGGTGGGVSLTEAAPSWQTAAGVLGTAGKRGVPDIAFDAAPSSGAIILISGSYYQIGGTSLSAPLFTGFYSRVQSAHGLSLGFPASALYAGAASNPSWFHDVTSGSNGGYSTATGWDYVTGYGSLQVQNFSASLSSGSGSTTPAPASWTTIANEGQAFTVNGTQTVRYGSGSSWISKSVTGSGTCSNAFFGSDPIYGVVKQCQTATAAAAPTTTWTRIAAENQSFSVSGSRTVRYGSGSSWISKSLTGSGTCSNAFFGTDPIYGVVKECDVAN